MKTAAILLAALAITACGEGDTASSEDATKRLAQLVSGSDGFDRYGDVQLEVAVKLINSGDCDLGHFRASIGWRRQDCKNGYDRCFKVVCGDHRSQTHVLIFPASGAKYRLLLGGEF